MSVIASTFLNDMSSPSIHIPGSVLAIMFSAIPIVVLTFGFWDQYADYLQSQSLRAYQKNVVEEFDFIIVGGGSAGSVLANRLSESGKYSVLLLEAGGNVNPMQRVPGFFHVIPGTSSVDYNFYTVPQTNACLGLNNQQSSWPRGKGVGGSSNLNAMFYQRGNKNDYDKWAEISGSDEWKFDNILRNFKNVEDYHSLYFDEKWHSNDGKGVYVSVSNQKLLTAEFLEAGREMGYPTKDVNGLQEASFSTLDVTIKNGRRHEAYSAFLEPAIKRKNLRIYRYARVLYLSFDKTRRAYGLTYRRHGVKRFVKVKKEIILSAGAIDSPKILMLSGIGPKKHLQEMNIGTVADLPVGFNLHDHIMTFFGPFMLETPNSSLHLERDITLQLIINYLNNGTGPFSTALSASGVAYIYSTAALDKIKNSSTEKVSPDIQLVILSIAPSNHYMFEKFFNTRQGFLSSYFGDSNLKDGFFVLVMLAKGKSRGEMKLASSNPMDKPLLDPKYFSHPDDIKALADGMNFTVTMIENTFAFQKHGAKLTSNPLPGCEGHPPKSLQYYECYARHMTLTVYHPCGTCSMGKGATDPKAVVDSKLRVLKTKGLRVIDASIIPEIPNSNINAAVYMIADKASEMILDHWSLKH